MQQLFVLIRVLALHLLCFALFEDYLYVSVLQRFCFWSCTTERSRILTWV